MSTPYFGLQCWPFPTTPDGSRYYPATYHEIALSRVLQGLDYGEGLLAVTGEAGSGKTLLGHCLLERLDEKTQTIFLTHGEFGCRIGLLQSILFELSLPYQGFSEQELRLALTEHLLHTYASGRKTLLVVDEAQHLSAELFEELRLLSNLEARTGKAVQIVLLGQPKLAEVLDSPEMSAFRQRVTTFITLEPLEVHESADYVIQHLKHAGCQSLPGPGVSFPFTDEALQHLVEACRGIPRLLNHSAHQALWLAHEQGARQADLEAVMEALAQLGVSVEEEDETFDEGVADYTGVQFCDADVPEKEAS